VDTPLPSQFAHELIHAMPYSFLDDEDAAARRARAVSLRRTLPDAVTDGAGRLDQTAIDKVREQVWPDIRDEHELHDLLLSLVALPLDFVQAAGTRGRDVRHWAMFFERLRQQGRAVEAMLVEDSPAWIAAERVPEAAVLWAALAHDDEKPADAAEATAKLVRGWLQVLGPATAAQLAKAVRLEASAVHQALLAMEMQGLVMRGVFERPRPADDAPCNVEWCERRILQRIHALTLRSLRAQVEPVSPAVFLRWLLEWQHVACAGDAETKLTGEEGVLAAIEQMEGFEAPAAEWERSLLPARVAEYDPRWLDNLCLAGIIGWGRVSPHPAWAKVADGQPETARRVIPTSVAPITFFLRESAEWMHAALAEKRIDEALLAQSLSAEAQSVRRLLADRGAAFSADVQRLTGLTKQQSAAALWELAAAGLASADGFDQLRAMMDPRRRTLAAAQRPTASLRKRAAARTTAGRWSLLSEASAPEHPLQALSQANEAQRTELIEAAKRNDAALDAHARILLGRYGVLFRELLTRESNAPKWRDLVPMLRRMEARGEIRGGRFVSGAFGEQFAVPAAVESLRAARRRMAEHTDEEAIEVAAADPLNLVGVIVPGERVAAIPGKAVRFRNGAPETEPALTSSAPRQRRRSVAELLRVGAVAPAAVRAESPRLFS
jgi:ATP-dependent Lhr-like helicase